MTTQNNCSIIKAWNFVRACGERRQTLSDYEKELIELLSSCKEEEKQSIAEMIHAILENYE